MPLLPLLAALLSPIGAHAGIVAVPHMPELPKATGHLPSVRKHERNGGGQIQMERDYRKLPTKGKPKKAPWNGHWWPNSDNGLGWRWWVGDPSPIEKYDEITGKSRKAVDWEISHHSASSGWEGQCDGFSLASVQEPEPAKPVVCRGVNFLPDDIKGLIGSLYLGDMSGQSVSVEGINQHQAGGGKELDPATFHLALTNVMGREGQGFYFDMADKPGQIFNMPAASYELKAEKINQSGKSALHVTCSIEIVNYMPPGRIEPGSVRTTRGVLEYLLELDEHDLIVPGGGAWIGNAVKEHPVAMKFPYGEIRRTAYNNPHMDPALVKELVAISAGKGRPQLCAQPAPVPAPGNRQPDQKADPGPASRQRANPR